MALLQRLFQNRRNAKQYNGSYYCQAESFSSGHPRPRLDKDRIRLLIYADTEKGRTPYFDSNAIQKVDEKPMEQKKGGKTTARLVPGCRLIHVRESSQEQPSVTGTNGVKYQYQKLGSDVKLLEEMMFGSVALAYKGSTLKVHHIRLPPQLVVTKVFYPQKNKLDSVSSEADCDSQPSSLSGSYDQLGDSLQTPTRRMKATNVMSIPVDVPALTMGGSFTDSTDEDSGLYSFTSSGSFQSLFPSPSNNSANSYNSLHRRWMRSQTTSLQRRWDSQETLNGADTSQLPKKKKKIKLAIGILFSTSNGKNSDAEKDSEEYRLFQNFFFAHMALIEGHVEVLQGAVEKAFFTGRNMVHHMFEALDQFRDSMYDLYMAPRLVDPVWLSMMSNIRCRYLLCERFMQEFSFLISKFDNKSTKFFVSTLLSAVLTYHLAWVATVTPGDGTPSKTYLEKHSAKWLDTLAKTHPYNPLWAQLGDLYGAIGNPLRVARTVVVGRKADLVKKFLYMLSYFIRCSDVHEEPFTNCLCHVLESQCWDTPVPSRTVSTEDGHVAESFPDLPSRSLSTETQMLARSLSTDTQIHVCSSCGSSSGTALSCSSPVVQHRTENTGVKRTVSIEGGKACAECGAASGRTCVAESRCHCDRCATGRSANCRCDAQCFCVKQQEGEPLVTESSSARTKEVECRGTNKTATDRAQTFSRPGSDAGTDSGIECSSESSDISSVCRMSAALILENNRLENMHHVRRSVEKGLPTLCEDQSIVQHSKDAHESGSGVRHMSRLSQQLADSEAVEKQKAKMREVQKQFLSGGSNSLFDEYYEGDAETKTIDDVSEQQRVVSHPLARSATTSPSPSVLSGGRAGSGEESVASPPLPSKNTSMSRQNSVDTKPHVSRPTSLNPARCRSVTPTELERRRHLSSTSSIDLDTFDPLVHCQEIAMPDTRAQPEQVEDYEKNFGRSLLGGYSDHYMSDFVLHGTSDTSFRPKLLQDIQNTLQHSILDEPVAESVCIIADTDNWTVEVANSRLLDISASCLSATGTIPWTTSHVVASLIESVMDLCRLKMSAEFCIMHIEDRLQELYFKSLMLSEYMNGVKNCNQQQLTSMLGFDASDLPLLLSIAGTHSPNLALGAEAKSRNSYSS